MEQTPGPEIAPYEQCPTTTEPLDGERGAAGIAPARPRDAYELEEEEPSEQIGGGVTRCAIRFASSNRMKRFDARGSRAKPDCLGLQHLWPRYQSRASSRAPSPRREEP